jgi:K+-sensing histidine kinase KdpD
MPTGQRLPVLRYGSAVVVTALATWARLLLDPVFGESLPFITYFIAVVVVAWYGGFGPAVVAVVLSALAADYFILHPRGNLFVHGREQQIGLALFSLLCLGIAALSASLQTARNRAERAEESERPCSGF